MSLGRLLGIQAARGAAAFLVLAFHTQNQLSWIVGYIPAHGVFGFGHAGVDFFFVLSGFIIYLVHARDIGQRGALAHYAWRRVMRIYPLYWLATAAFFVMAYLPSLWSHPPDLWWVVSSFILLPQGRSPILAVGWSLQHEMFFYFIFGTLIAHRKIGLLLCAIWLAAIAHGIAAAPGSLVLTDLASPFDLQFFMGIGAAHIILRWRVAAPRLLAALGVGGFVVTAWLELTGRMPSDDAWGRLWYGGASTLIVIGLAAGERQGRLRFGGWAAWFGGMSYALYLFHIIILGMITGICAITGAGEILPGWLLVAGSLAATLLISAWLHWGIELPVIARLQVLRAAISGGGR
jgi:exopolysaccharide production protein ExoZ